MKKKCEVEGCDGKHYAKGLCSKHYRRLWIGGDPHTPSCYDLSIEERFRKELAPQDPATGCIEWTGARNNYGYGRIRHAGGLVLTHRLAYELKHGPIPPGMEVCHKCDNPPCVNEDHLCLDTHAGNMADRDSKGRGNQPKGEKHGNAKLTEASVLEIRRRIATGELQRVIAKDFGISRPVVGQISRGQTWSHLNPK
jgi:hypothetical protein